MVVADDGGGLPEHADRLLERFARAGTTSTATGSRRYGLGLALVREIAIGHGGRFDLQPNISGGTTARITLPVAG